MLLTQTHFKKSMIDDGATASYISSKFDDFFDMYTVHVILVKT